MSGFNFLDPDEPYHLLDRGNGSTASTYYDDLSGVNGDSKMFYIIMDQLDGIIVTNLQGIIADK